MRPYLRGLESTVGVSAEAREHVHLGKFGQHYPFAFRGAADDKAVYAALKALTSR